MRRDDLVWCIDTIWREEDVLRELQKRAKREGQHEIAEICQSLVRELFGVRQMLEQERSVLERIRPGYAGPERRHT